MNCLVCKRQQADTQYAIIKLLSSLDAAVRKDEQAEAAALAGELEAHFEDTERRVSEFEAHGKEFCAGCVASYIGSMQSFGGAIDEMQVGNCKAVMDTLKSSSSISLEKEIVK